MEPEEEISVVGVSETYSEVHMNCKLFIPEIQLCETKLTFM